MIARNRPLLSFSNFDPLTSGKVKILLIEELSYQAFINLQNVARYLSKEFNLKRV